MRKADKNEVILRKAHDIKKDCFINFVICNKLANLYTPCTKYRNPGSMKLQSMKP